MSTPEPHSTQDDFATVRRGFPPGYAGVAIAALDHIEEQFSALQREYRDYYEMTRSLVAQLEQMEVERAELENLVSQLLRREGQS